MKFILKFMLNALGVILTVFLLPGVHANGIATIFIITVVLAILNGFLKPILIILSLPFTILTLGLFLVVINVIIIMISDYLIEGFQIEGIGWAIAFSIVLSAVSSILEAIFYSSSKE